MGNDFSWDSRCVALYRFESGALTVDSIGDNMLTNVNSVAEDTVNFKEGACSALFTPASSHYFRCTDANLDSGFPCKSSQANRSFTVPFWIKPNAMGGESYGIVDKYQGGTGDYHKSFRIYLGVANSKIGMALVADGTNDQTWFNHGTAMTDDGNHWYHVTITYNSTNGAVRIRIWDDTAGTILGTDLTDTYAETLNVGNAPFNIGLLGVSKMDGNMDEIPIFNAALSTNEIDAIWAGTYANPAPTKTMVFYENLITASSMITASSEATNYEKAYLIDKAHSTCWRSTGVSSESLLIDFGEAKSINTLAVGNHNLLAEVTTLDLKYGSTDSCTDGTIDLLDDIVEDDFIKFLQSISYRYWKLVIEGATNITYYEIGELWLGVKVELNKNPLPLIDPFNKKYVAHERGSYGYDLYGLVSWPLEWGSYNNTTNHDILLALWNTVKKSSPFWIMLDADNNNTLQYVTIKEFRFDQDLGVGYPGRMLVESSN